MLTLPQIFSGNFTFLSPNYFIASLWGYILALLYLEKKGNPRTLLKTNLALALLSVLAGFFLSFYKHIAATRQNVSAPYVLISIGIIILLQMFIFLIHKTGTGKNKTSWLAKMGAHPLSYWILHSFVISAAVAAANLIRYYNENMISYFLQAPVTPRVIENHGVAIIASILTAGLCAWVHMNFIKTRPIV
jgi:predicted acyltransferase